MTDICPVCPETGRPMSRGVRPLIVRYRGRSKTVEMPGWYSDGSDESVHTRDDMKVSGLALVTLKAEEENLATPEEVRRIRKNLRLSQSDAGRILGGGLRAFQKYESGAVLASRAMTNLLRTLMRHPEEVERFRADAGIAERRTSA